MISSIAHCLCCIPAWHSRVGVHGNCTGWLRFTGLGPILMNNTSDQAGASQQHCLDLLKVASFFFQESQHHCTKLLQQLSWTPASKHHLQKPPCQIDCS